MISVCRKDIFPVGNQLCIRSRNLIKNLFFLWLYILILFWILVAGSLIKEFLKKVYIYSFYIYMKVMFLRFWKLYFDTGSI